MVCPVSLFSDPHPDTAEIRSRNCYVSVHELFLDDRVCSLHKLSPKILLYLGFDPDVSYGVSGKYAA